MKYQETFESCKELALKCGYVKKSRISTHATYIDPFACGFEIHYSEMLARGLNKMQESMHVYLGGREVFCYTEGDDSERYVDGSWHDLMEELQEYELYKKVGESFREVNHSLVEVCRRASERNCEIFEKYTMILLEITKKLGVRKNGSNYVYNDGAFEIELNRSQYACFTVWCWYEKELVFKYYWGDDKSPGGLLDKKGRYSLKKPWLVKIESIYESLSSSH